MPEGGAIRRWKSEARTCVISHLIHLCGVAAIAFALYQIADQLRARFSPVEGARPWSFYGTAFSLMITGVIVFGHQDMAGEGVEGVLLDARGVVVAVSTIIGGYAVGATTTLVGMACRYGVGGLGTGPDLIGLGVGYLLCAGLVWIWRRRQGAWAEELWLLASCGLAVGTTETAAFLLIEPLDTGLRVFRELAWAEFLTQWVGTVVMGSLIHYQRARGWFREMLEGALRTSIDGFALFDETGRLREVNGALVRMTGHARAKLLSMNVAGLRADPQDDEWSLRLPQLRRDGFVRFESRWRRKDGGVLDLAVSAALAPKGVGGIYAFVQDITQRKRAEAEARLQEARLRVALDAAEMLTWELDVATGVLAYSPNLTSLAGSPEVVPYLSLGTFLEQLHPDDRERTEAAMGRTLETGENFDCDYRVRLPDGSMRWMVGKGKCIPGPDGRPVRVVGASVDLSERRRAEDAERRAQLINRELIESVPGAFYMLDAGGAYVRWNRHLREDLIGRTEEQMPGFPALDPIHPDDREDLRKRIVAVLRDGIEESAEARIVVRGGPEIRWYLFTGRRVVFDGVPHLIGIGIDITARKEMESTLRDERERLSGILEGTHVGTWEWTIPTGAVVFNERWAAMVGYTLEELGPPTVAVWSRLAHPEDLRISQERLERHFRGELPYYECEVRMRHKDGGWIWVLDRGKVTRRTDDGRPLLMQGTHTDVTERVGAEQRARLLRDLGMQVAAESSMPEALRLCLQTACEVSGLEAGGIYLVDGERGDLRLAHHRGLGPAFVRAVARVPADSRQARWAREGHFYYGSVQDLKVLASAPEAIEGLRAISLLPIRHEGRLLAIMNVASHAVPTVPLGIRDSLETVAGLIGGMLQRFRAQEDLREAHAELERRVEERTRELGRSEGRHRMLFEALQDAIIASDETGRVVDCSVSAVSMFGFHDKEAMRAIQLEALSPRTQPGGGDSHSLLSAHLGRVMAEGRLFFEWEHRRVDGTTFPTEVSMSVAWIDGRPVMQGVIRDISERKAAENGLRASEARFRRLLEMAPLPLGLSNREGDITYLNARHTRTFGYTQQDVPTLDAWWTKAYPDAEYRQLVQDRWLAAMEQSSGGEVDLGTQWFRVTCKDGSTRDVVVTGVMLGEEFLAAFLDVTRLHEATENLRTLSQAVQYSPSMILITDDQGQVEYANPAWEQVTGFSLEEVRGQKPRALKSGVHSRQFYEALWGEITAGRVWRGEFCNRRKDGELYWESCAIAPVRDELGVIRHYVAVKEDNTARRAAEAELRQAKEAADAANEAKSRFLANMSHEIRTPMNAILGFARLLQRDPTLTSRQHHQLTVINQSGEHLLQLINDILDMSKIEAGRMQLTLAPGNFRAMTAEMEQLYRQRAEERGLDFSWECAPDVPALLRTDASKVRQVFLNLLSNAIKFTASGAIQVRISVVSRAAPEGVSPVARLRVEVSDTGDGIAAEELERVFEAFEQTRTGRRLGGTGLGMPISRQIARMLGGDVTVTSALGQGSRFRFEFVADEVSGPAGQSGPAAPLRRCLRLVRGTPVPLILIVDDIASNRDLLRAVLEEAGFQVGEAGSGAEAISRCLEECPALILMDRRMPGMDGLEATRAIRGSAVGASTPVVILSAGVLEAREDEWRAAGADAFLGKPFRDDELLECIARLLGLGLEESPDARPAVRKVALPTAREALPDELRAEMLEATETGDIERLRELILGQVMVGKPELGEALLELAQRFDYASLRRALSGDPP